MDKPVVSDLIGRVFVNRGRELETGLDCWGLVMEVLGRYGIDIPDYTVDAFAFKRISELAGEAVESRTWEEVHWPVEKDAPLVVLMMMAPGYVTHAGVYLGDGKIMHTMEKTGVVVSTVKRLERVITGYYKCLQ